MQEIPLVRFNALAGYCRDPMARITAEEVAWYEQGGECVLGAIIRDRNDGDFGGIVLGRDENGRFRWIGGLREFHVTPDEAARELSVELERCATEPAQNHWQGDTKGEIVDFYEPVVSRRQLNDNFVLLADLEGYSPARGIIEPMMKWYEDLDGNFVQQFQTTGFDARLWELYLFAVFVELGYRIGNIHAVPDFDCGGPFGEFVVEATSVNPTQGRGGKALPAPTLVTMDEIMGYLKEYMPIKYASALTTKLKRKYWEMPNVAGKPLLFAIMDFSSPGSMVNTTTSLPLYLYGFDYDHDRDRMTGRLRIHPRKVKEHRWGNKTVPSGFFDLPGAENVSAVLYSNSGTISKFERMGIVAGFGSKRIRVFRKGTVFDPDPDASLPKMIQEEVTGQGYSESWTEGISVFHNPKALAPISEEMLPGTAHHRLLPDGQRSDSVLARHVFASRTFIGEPLAQVGEKTG